MGDPGLGGDRSGPTAERGGLFPEWPGPPGRSDLLTREHRLYQVDWLLRKYGFEADEIPLDASGYLSLERDPKEVWAKRHAELFPLDVNRADREALLRVPGFGAVTVERILTRRREARLRSVDDIGKPGKRLTKAAAYVQFGS